MRINLIVFFIYSHISVWFFFIFIFPPTKMMQDVKKLLCLLQVHDKSIPLNIKRGKVKRKGFVHGTLNATKILCNISKLI